MTEQAQTALKRCLLITPLTFYAFHNTLKAALERRGYSVDMLNEEYPANVVGKILGKTALPILRWSTLVGLRKRLDSVGRYDLVLIVKGRGIGPAAIELLRTYADRIVGYNFDSFRFNPSPLDWHFLTDRYATFDIVDAENFEMPLVHLFTAATSMAGSSKSARDLSIVMRIHSDRLAYVDCILRAMKGRPVFVFLFASSRLTFLLHALRAPGPAFRLRQYIAFKPLSYRDAMESISNSCATLDYAHPLQTGITVRCFEAQSLGIPVITNNPHVVKSQLFPVSSVATLPLDGSSKMLKQRLASFDDITFEPTRRDTDAFIIDLLGEDQ